jgi:ATPase family associated with various cellular activities (AAA)
MTYFLKSGATYRITTKDAIDLHETLPAGNYVVKQDPMENFFIEKIEDFVSPKKLYGDVISNTNRIISTFKSREKSTGVLLVGEKGSGKTMLSMNTCIELAKEGVPTIVINAPWCGDKFNTLIQSIEQPCIVLFDEFEKVYDSEQQEAMLTLLDGIYSSKKLFMLTCNDKWRVNSHMQNRPGRIFYMKNFVGLDEGFIREYLADNLANKAHTETFVRITSVFSAFNFDMMKAMVEEMNRYDETPQQALSMLNVRAEFDGGSSYEIDLSKPGAEIMRVSPTVWQGTPLHNDGLNFNYQVKRAGDDQRYDWEEIEFDSGNLLRFDAKIGKFIFEKDGVTAILTKVKSKSFNFDAF